jgi:undecaprenyl-diphosphatase
MNFLQAATYGIVQGLGEFLPISSSAHLTLLPWFLGWEDPGLAFDVALHVGTLLALLVYFRRDLIDFAGAFLAIARERRIGEDPTRRLAVYVLCGSLPGAVIGYLLEKRAEDTFRNPLIIAAAMATLGTALFFVDRFAKQARHLGTMSLKDAILIGLAQACAIVPGVSRSGATITAARAFGFDRESSARFSFLLAIPITAGAALVKVPKLLHATKDVAPLAVAVAMAAVSGYLALGFLMRWVQTRSYLPFVIYRVLFAVTVVAVYFTRGR